MISAKLMSDLGKEGFNLIFPGYKSNEERIIDIITEDNERLYGAIPLFLKQDFDYNKIIKKLNPSQKRTFNRIILITNKILKSENIDRTHLEQIIRKYKIKIAVAKEEFRYYYESFKDSIKNLREKEEDKLKDQIRFKGEINIKKALSIIYSPAKIRIMDKIFNHERLTNTELKYYYKSIRPLIKAIMNKDMQDYLTSIENTKKYVET